MDNVDYIEQLITASCHLETEYDQGKASGMDPKKLAAIREESDLLWNMAKELGRDRVTGECYRELANAIILQAVKDYERMICGTTEPNIPPSIMGDKKTIENFLRAQRNARVDMSSVVDKINHAYYYEFIPYADKHYQEMKQSWEAAKKRHTNVIFPQGYRHRCPLCGGMLRVFKRRGFTELGVGCTGCDLYYYNPKWEVE